MSLSATTSPATGNARSRFSGDVMIALALLAVALLVRLHQIGEASLWVDEAASLAFAEASWHAIWVTTPRVETNPPLYYALLKLWIDLFGVSEASLRLPSALFSTLCVLPLYALGRAAGGRAAGLMAGGLFILSGYQIQYAQEARAFAAMVLAFLLALWAARTLVVADGREPSPGQARLPLLAGLVGSCAVLPLLHHTGIFAVAAVFVFALIGSLAARSLTPRLLREIVLAGLAVVLLSLPVLYWISIHLDAEATLVDWIPRPDAHAAYSIYRATFGFSFVRLLDPLIPSNGLIGRLTEPYRLADGLLALACLAGIVAAFRRRNPVILGALAALAFVVVAFFAASQIKPILLPRTVLFAGPLVLLLAAYGATSLPRQILRPGVCLLLLLVSAVNAHTYFRGNLKEPWRAAIAETAELHAPSTRIAAYSGAVSGSTLFGLYWPGLPAADGPLVVLNDNQSPLAPLLNLRLPTEVVAPDGICPALAGAEALFVIERRRAELHPIEALDAGLAAAGGTRIAERFHPPHLVVSHWSGPFCPT